MAEPWPYTPTGQTALACNEDGMWWVWRGIAPSVDDAAAAIRAQRMDLLDVDTEIEEMSVRLERMTGGGGDRCDWDHGSEECSCIRHAEPGDAPVYWYWRLEPQERIR